MPIYGGVLFFMPFFHATIIALLIVQNSPNFLYRPLYSPYIYIYLYNLPVFLALFIRDTKWGI